ncbi:MAG: hypothetical protein ACI9KM_001770 [Rubritalea sp.]
MINKVIQLVDSKKRIRHVLISGLEIDVVLLVGGEARSNDVNMLC